jgi:hypothetical protein
MPAQWWQGCLRINYSKDTIIMLGTIAMAMTAKMPAHWWQWCHHNKGNDASLTMSNKGNNASLTMAETPAYWQWQQDHCDKSNSCHCDNSKKLVHWWKQHHHDKGNNASLMTSNKGNDTCMCTHANKHIICSCLHTPLQIYHMFEFASQLANLANLSSQASLQTLPTIAEGERKTNENCCAIMFGGNYGFKDGAESMILSALPVESIILSARLSSPLSPLLLLSPSMLLLLLLLSLPLSLLLPTSNLLPPPLLLLSLPSLLHFLLQLLVDYCLVLPAESIILSACAESIILCVCFWPPVMTRLL